MLCCKWEDWWRRRYGERIIACPADTGSSSSSRQMKPLTPQGQATCQFRLQTSVPISNLVPPLTPNLFKEKTLVPFALHFKEAETCQFRLPGLEMQQQGSSNSGETISICQAKLDQLNFLPHSFSWQLVGRLLPSPLPCVKGNCPGPFPRGWI